MALRDSVEKAHPKVRDDVVDVADGFLLMEELLELVGQREEARPDRLHQKETLLASEVEEDAGFVSIERGGLFEKDALACFERVFGVGEVKRVRCAYVDNVYLL